MNKEKKSRQKPPEKSGKLAHYRPLVDGAIFVLSLLGILVVVHLWIQTGRGFDRGCFGFTASEQVTATVDCEAVTTSAAGTLFGVSNVLWGLLFYVGLAVLSFMTVTVSADAVARVRKLRALAIAAGFAYSLYLVYVQYVTLDQFCRLCLISASVVAALFVVQLIDYLSAPPSGEKGRPSWTRFAALMAVTVVVGGADVMYFRNLPAAQESAGADPEQNTLADADAIGECLYDPEKARVENYRDLVSFSDPSKGNPEAPVTVIEFFDPNCPHCMTLHPVMEEVVRRQGDKAWFVWRPFVLWEYSLSQVEALYFAAQDGKFFEMLEAQFLVQRQGGIPLPELVEISAGVGMDPNLTATRLQRGLYRNIIMRQRQTAIEAGVTTVPAVMINGRFVHGASRTLDCLGTMIEAAAG